jgi:hypothetical protein
MNAAATSWTDMNQRHLLAAVASVRDALRRHVARSAGATAGGGPEVAPTPERAAASPRPPPALDALVAAFGLSPFERDVLLLCAGVDLDASFAALCAEAQGDQRRSDPTFGLALAALPHAHWSALAPDAPLRYWRMIEPLHGTGETLTSCSLRLDERVLHHLTGVVHLDERLEALVEPLAPPTDLPVSQATLARRIAAVWSEGSAGTPGYSLVQVCGGDPDGQRAIAASAGALLGLRVLALYAADIPAGAAEREALRRAADREAVLSGSVLLVDAHDLDALQSRPISRFLERLRSPVIVSTRDPLRAVRRLMIRLDARSPSAAEQEAIWRDALGPAASGVNGEFASIAQQFRLGATAIRAVSAAVAAEGSADAAAVWDACRAQARPQLDDLAQRIEPAAAGSDLVLPAAQRQILREIQTHVRQRALVYERWGFAAKGARGLGISALFAGPSGTGKTMAAEVLAHELRLDLYRIDLSQVVSKYIGETEKNLRRVFDAAESCGAILLFDEADALFGKRSEVKDSHDRYANIEVSYLLQRMEAYHGLAILTTNLKGALDPAFLRRIRFVVEFPFPDAAQRAEIWRRMLPAELPTEGLVVEQLARLAVPGGSIRNIALHGAFLAADAGEALRMSHLLSAARREYAKLERPLTDAELGGWT